MIRDSSHFGSHALLTFESRTHSLESTYMNLLKAIVLLPLIACGGTDEVAEQQPNEVHLVGLDRNQPVWSDGIVGEHPDTLGQAQKAIIVPQAGLAQVGTRPGSLDACEVGNTGQDLSLIHI